MSQAAEGRMVPLAVLRTDGGTQQRVKLNDDHVKELAEAVLAKKKLPPAVAFYDGKSFWLADGFHSKKAHEAAQRDKMLVDVREGSQRDAVLFSVGANAEHGLKRTNEDKRKAVLVLLNDKEWSQWSDGKIAEAAGVSQRFVSSMRPSGQNRSDLKDDEDIPLDDPPKQERRIGRDGKSYPAKKKTSSKPKAKPKPAADASTPAAQPPELPQTDGWGIPIQPHAVEAFAAGPLFDELLAKLKECRKLYAALAEHKGGAYLLRPGVSINARDSWKHQGIENAILIVKDNRPALTVCPYAFNEHHEHTDECTLCRGLNWTRPLEKGRVPEELIRKAKESFGV